MKKNIFVSILIIIAIVLSCNTVKIKKEKDFSNYYDSNTIYDPIFGRFICGKIKGDSLRENYKIIIIDTTIVDSLRGHAQYLIYFEDIRSFDLEIDSVKLEIILLKNNEVLEIIRPGDKEFKYYDSLLTPEIKKFVCWKLEGYENYQYFKYSYYSIPFEIHGIKK